MPLTPETWLEEFTVNLNTNGVQSAPRITQLANGNILVTWVSSDPGGVGAPFGQDIIGQIFDPLGNRIGGEFLVNANSSGSDERDHDTAAIATTGGFVTVYERDTGSFDDIQLSEHDSTGAVVNTVNIFFDGSGSANPSGFDPRVVVNSAGIAMVVWRQTDASGDSVIMARSYDTATNTLGTATSVIAFAGGNFTPDVTALTNGNFVIVDRFADTDNEIIIRIINPAMGNVLGVTEIVATRGDGDSDSTPTVTALTGGGFVVAWANTDANDTDIELQVFNAAGTSVSGLLTATLQGATDDGNEPVVVALSDGGFIVLFDEDTLNQLQGRRYDSTGVQVGGLFVVSTGGAITEPNATLLGDGRVAITFVRNGGEIGMEIIDTRDNANNPGVYTPDQWQIGTVGDDIFTADGTSEFVAAYEGNDTVTESGQIRTYLMGSGNDRLNVVSAINSDVHDGGTGNDTIDWSGAFVTGATFDLALQTATAGASTEQMLSFENLIGTNNDDVINGTAGVNNLQGRDGNDTIDGGLGADQMAGGIGNDIYYVDNAGDVVTEAFNAGTDAVRTTISWTLGANFERLALLGVGNINATGNALANVIGGNSGNNQINGGAGDDFMAGFLGNDIYYVTSAGDATSEQFNEGIDIVRSYIDRTLGNNLERLELYGAGNINGTGNALDNALVGNGGLNVLNGAAGNDVIRGGIGNDVLIGGAGLDAFQYTAANQGGDTITDFLNIAGNNDQFRFSAAGFGGGLVAGALNPLFFQSRADNLAQDANDRFIFRTTDQTLWFDVNGNAAGGLTLIADMQVGAVVTAGDILIF